MPDIIVVEEEYVEEYAEAVDGAARYFKENPLVPCDTRSTISANGRGHCAYYHAQEVIAAFGSCLEREAANIRSLGAEFAEYDAMLAELWNSGTRYPVITGVE